MFAKELIDFVCKNMKNSTSDLDLAVKHLYNLLRFLISKVDGVNVAISM